MRVAFDAFTFDSEHRELARNGSPIHLGPKAFRLLELLLEHRPKPIAKHELSQRIWEDTVVDESNLAGLINELRQALGDRARDARYIRTVHGFGYAFCGADSNDEPAAFVTFRHQRLPLREGENVLGRDATADVQIDDATVSRKHAVIRVRADGVTIEDLDSKNGTFIDGEQLHGTAELTEGQSFVLGDVTLAYRSSQFAGSTVSVSRMRKR